MQIPGEDLGPYRAASKAILAVLQRYGPAEKFGMDEVWVDVTQVRRGGGRTISGVSGQGEVQGLVLSLGMDEVCVGVTQGRGGAR